MEGTRSSGASVNSLPVSLVFLIIDSMQMPLISAETLSHSEPLLRRAHLVLTWILHVYIHTLPLDTPILIPKPLAIPLLQVGQILDIPPVHTLSDESYYNWAYRVQGIHAGPTVDNIRCLTTFTGTKDEEEFYLATTRIELRGSEALKVIVSVLREGSDITTHRLVSFLCNLSNVIKDLKVLLLAVRQGCDTGIFYHDIRPWFSGQDAKRPWIFEGLEKYPELKVPKELSGATAAQSPLIQALDIFLGIDSCTHSFSSGDVPAGSDATSADSIPAATPNFLERMQIYMPRHHRAFLRHLASNNASPRALRTIVSDIGNDDVREAYNMAVSALKEFRDAHIRIITLYVLGPLRRMQWGEESAEGIVVEKGYESGVKGSGGSDMVKFLKGVRDVTARSIISPTVGERNQASD